MSFRILKQHRERRRRVHKVGASCWHLYTWGCQSLGERMPWNMGGSYGDRELLSQCPKASRGCLQGEKKSEWRPWGRVSGYLMLHQTTLLGTVDSSKTQERSGSPALDP
jgi:hypothetical protein